MLYGLYGVLLERKKMYSSKIVHYNKLAVILVKFTKVVKAVQKCLLAKHISVVFYLI